MDVTYTDPNRTDCGILRDFRIDFDTADTMDHVVTMGIDRHILTGGSYWYIDGTEYGGIVDQMEIVTQKRQVRYSGRSFRGLLCSKIIEPPAGEDHRTASGSLSDIAEELLEDTEMQDLFSVASCRIMVDSYQFKRYASLYDGLLDLAFHCGRVIALRCHMGKNGRETRLDTVTISFEERIDYSQDYEYTNDNIRFRITKGYNMVNHLICLGKGELKDRLVAHLYVDGDRDIVEKQYYFGLEEMTEVYELSAEEDLDALKKAGADRLGEIMDTDRIEVSVSNDISLKIGDVIGGYEQFSGISVRREITNIVADLDDDGIVVEYTVGGDEPGAASLPSEIVDEYVLPIASSVILGGIKIGTTLNMDGDVLDSQELAEFKQELAQAVAICT